MQHDIRYQERLFHEKKKIFLLHKFNLFRGLRKSTLQDNPKVRKRQNNFPGMNFRNKSSNILFWLYLYDLVTIDLTLAITFNVISGLGQYFKMKSYIFDPGYAGVGNFTFRYDLEFLRTGPLKIMGHENFHISF